MEKTLGEVAIFTKGKGISKSDIAENGKLPCIRYGELYTHYNETISDIKSHTNLDPNDLILSEVNDVIIPASGETQIDIATASCVLGDGIALGGDLNIIKTNINGVFLAYYLNSAKKRDIAQIAQGISVVHLYSNQLKSLIVNIPNPQEQQKIADCLSSFDALITTQTQKLQALQQHKKGLMQNLFPAEGKTTPKLRFPEFKNSGKWQEYQLCNIVDVIDGDRGKNYPKQKDFFNDEYCLFLNAKNVTKTGLIFNEVQFITKECSALLGKGKLKMYDIVLTTRGSIGHFAYYSDDTQYQNIRINSGMVLLRVNSAILLSNYFYKSCSSLQINKQIKTMSFGSAQPQLTVREINKIKIEIPKPAEQQKIADCLSSLDALITTQTQKLQALQQHKKGLMQQLFIGNKS